jgi:membrane fusion protein, multidrug efflux system
MKQLLVPLLLASSIAQADPKQTRGVIKSLNQAVLSSEISARVEQMPYRAGESFHKGELLLQFNCDLFTAQVEKVSAEQRATAAKLENDRRLDKMRSIGHLEVTLSEIALRQSEAELKMAKLNQQRCQIHAPWDGRIIQWQVNEQESVELNQPLIAIVSTGKLEAELVISGDWLQWIKPNTPFTMHIDETNSSVEGKVLVLGSVVDSTSQTVTVRGSIEQSPNLLPGMSGTAVFE